MKWKVLIYFIIIISLLSYIIFKNRGLKDYLILKYKYNQVKVENENLKNENEKYKILIEKLKKDKSYIEKIAREKYNMIGKDEILIKIEGKGGKK